MHLTAPGGSQSPEGQTGTETYERGGLRTASSRSWVRFDAGRRSPRRMAILIRRQASYPAGSAAAALPGTSRVREPAGGQTFTQLQGSNSLATEIGIRELLEAGVHFGHQTRRWNPKMRRFIFGERGGIHIIDLQKTERLLHTAQEFAGDLAGRGGTILFVGTKKQARDSIKEAATSSGMPYIDQRWLGGLLTNFQTINKRIRRLHDLRDWTESGTMELLPVRERIAAINERDKLETNLGGVADMQRPPDAMFVVDLKVEDIGVREAKRLKIPIIGLVDTNCDPDPVDFVIPGNDDAIRSCKIIIEGIADVARDRATQFRAEEEAARREREEAERREAEEKAQREAEEQERREAEERARREAEEAGFSPDEPATPSGTRPEAASGAGAPRERRTFDPDEES
jgi:small subunit ribosomal protein S2